MLRFSCDCCGKDLSPEAGGRFVVKVEVFAAHDPAELTEDDLADDQLAEVAAFLEENDGVGEEDLAPASKGMRFDLCPDCHKKFLRDPLNREAATKFDFSKN